MHALYGSDDGAKSEAEMNAIIDTAYDEGARYICLTPHYHPGYYGRNREKSEVAFSQLTEYVSSKYGDLQIALGNELHYEAGCEYWLVNGMCRTLNETKYVLVDFSTVESKRVIQDALSRFLSVGYLPILAHAERYVKIYKDWKLLDMCAANGILIQLDAGSLFGEFGFRARRFAKAILARGLADFIASDAHDTNRRPPQMARAYEYVKKKYGQPYADKICLENAKKLFFEKSAKEA